MAQAQQQGQLAAQRAHDPVRHEALSYMSIEAKILAQRQGRPDPAGLGTTGNVVN
jgi:hypothetical protein